jgi:hypothetical protein
MIETPLQTGLSRLVVSTLGVARHCRVECKACVKQGVGWRGKYLAVSAGWRSKKIIHSVVFASLLQPQA